MIDVLRNAFRPASDTQNESDLEFIKNGGVLEVAAWDWTKVTGRGIRFPPRGVFQVIDGEIVWKSAHRRPSLVFHRGDWILGDPPKTTRSSYAHVGFVDKTGKSDGYVFRIPRSDRRLVFAAMSEH